MAIWSCRKARQVLDNCRRSSVSNPFAARAIYLTEDVLGEFRLGQGSGAAYAALRARLPFRQEDSDTENQIIPALEAARSGAILDVVETAVGPLS